DLTTFTIRISMAELLIDEFDDPSQAYRELLACEEELTTHADEYERKNWRELATRCNKIDNGADSEV
ncbi:MAG TPA: hypothetical protein VGL71_03565, partial [Urbifossiella sp.]